MIRVTEDTLRRLQIPRLAAARVRAATQQRFATTLLRFMVWMQLATFPALWPAVAWGEAIADYLEMLFDLQRARADANLLPSTLLWARPALGGPCG